MKKIFFLIIICNLIIVDLRAQIIQNIRGKIYEANTENLLLGANIQLFDLQGKFISGANSDENGAYKITNIPIGKYNLMISYTGYEKVSLPNIEVNAGKELIIDVALEESVTQLDAKVEIIADNVNKAVNESAIISTVSFNQVESEKYAGSRSDIARMAANYAGVMGADDSRNDIVVRGNSPANLIWRLEGVEIYNPNHFNIAGTQGGPVTIINSKYIGKSDFFTGAFPAEYGNSTSAVFDLRLKNGNNEKHEFSAQLGIIGAELFAEGPLNKSKKSNYWINYRYSTVSLLQKVGINIGTNSKTSYQDLAFKLQFPFKNNAYLNFFGIGGKSSSDILISDQTEPTDEIDIYAENDRDQYFKSKMALLGVSFSKSFANDKTYFKTTLIGQAEGQDVVHNLIFRHLDTANKYVYDSLPNLIDYTFAQHKISSGSYVNHKLNVHWLLKGGVNADLMFYDFIDSTRASEHPFIDSVINPLWSKYYIRWDSKGAAFLIQPYIQTTWRPTNKLKFIFGLHSQIFTYNNDVSPIEPRASAQYIISNSQNISFGTGLYSQINPIYLTEFRDPSLPYGNTFYNRHLKMTKSYHNVLSYNINFNKNLSLKVEVYYQYLYDIPIDSIANTAFSFVNAGSGFGRQFPRKLTNNGTGRNVGLELTLLRNFSNHYYYMINASVFDAKYKGSDQTLRNTTFNGKYLANLLFAKEFVINAKQTINFGGKISFAGGRWYGIVDTIASTINNEVVFTDKDFNTKQFKPYFRFDLKFNYKLNVRGITHEIGLDLVNVLNIKNISSLTWAPNPADPSQSPIREEYQLGRLPLFYYRIDF